MFERARPAFEAHGCRGTVLGGGRIRHGPNELFVYGYSVREEPASPQQRGALAHACLGLQVDFGMADHAKTLDLLRSAYHYDHISYSNEGY